MDLNRRNKIKDYIVNFFAMALLASGILLALIISVIISGFPFIIVCLAIGRVNEIYRIVAMICCIDVMMFIITRLINEIHHQYDIRLK